ncbi:hypothetical protein BKA65DRAFT_471761 [Rhexocercosporidium sp. MPI-PUGE-AT-0058]|nr:hypothetical protein BKA65DRAFT_471761 [Rhexocercosporidium sp. MPI-PUGE-AT-0058]
MSKSCDLTHAGYNSQQNLSLEKQSSIPMLVFTMLELHSFEFYQSESEDVLFVNQNSGTSMVRAPLPSRPAYLTNAFFSFAQTKQLRPLISSNTITITTTTKLNIQNHLKMADQSGSANTSITDKGKGKGAAEPENDTTMDVDDSSSDEEVEVDEDDVVEEQDDEMSAMDRSNIIESGRRTRGVKIDYAKAAEEMKQAGEMDEDSEDDDDFEEPIQESDSEMKDK